MDVAPATAIKRTVVKLANEVIDAGRLYWKANPLRVTEARCTQMRPVVQRVPAALLRSKWVTPFMDKLHSVLLRAAGLVFLWPCEIRECKPYVVHPLRHVPLPTKWPRAWRNLLLARQRSSCLLP